jgi:hypothetical protein
MLLGLLPGLSEIAALLLVKRCVTQQMVDQRYSGVEKPPSRLSPPALFLRRQPVAVRRLNKAVKRESLVGDPDKGIAPQCFDKITPL